MIVQTYNIPLLMDDANATHWYSLLVCARDAYNMCTRILHDNKVPLSLKKVHEACYNVIRTEFPALSSQMVIKCEQAAAAALKSIKSNKHKNAEVPQRKSLTMTLDKRLYGVLTSEGITITGVQKNKRTFVPFNAYPKAKEMLQTYKAPLAGKQVETVSPMYTSQMDCRTNTRDGERRGRRYICVDGVIFDSDWNAAINIGQRSNHPVSSSLPIEGQLVILTGREQSTSQSTHL